MTEISMETSTEITPELKAAIEAVDALNSWVRSKSFGHSLRSPRHAIYWLKRCAIEAAHEAGLARHQRVGVIVTCRDCSGTGRYYSDRDGCEYDHCWKCSNSGQLILYFVETAIALRPEMWSWPMWKWHTPQDLWPRAWREWLPNEFPHPTSWKTDAEGKDLSPAEAAAHLNTAEAYFPQRPTMRRIDFDYQSEMRDDFDYRLYVGLLGSHCVFCGAERDRPGLGHHACRGSIEWNAFVCKSCEEREGSVWQKIPWPDALLRSDSLQLWLERHPAKETKNSTRETLK